MTMVTNQAFRKVARKIWRPLYATFEKQHTKMRTFQVSIDKLLCGGENGIRSAKYAELTGDFLRPSQLVFESPHVKLLQEYSQKGEKIFEKDCFENTDYYKNANICIRLTGSYFYDRSADIVNLAKRFVAQHLGKDINLPRLPGQSGDSQPVWLRAIKDSSYYEIIDGHHRIARAIMRGESEIDSLVYEKDPVYTPLQQLLLDCLWINKKKWLYQPVDSPELKENWKLIRKCDDRLRMMSDFLQSMDFEFSKKTYLDVGSSYGWFVKKFSEMGFDSKGLERDPFGIDVGLKVYNINPAQIIHADIIKGLEELVKQGTTYEVVSCLSVLHHFVLQKNSRSAEDFIKLLDKVSEKVLFLDTGEEHEAAFEGALSGWNPQFISQWIKKETSFKNVIPLGVDQDCCYPFQGYYKRTLFACLR